MRLWFLASGFATALVLVSFGSSSAQQPVWTPSWAAAMQTAEPAMKSPNMTFADESVRNLLRVRVGGSQVRVHFSNLFGATPLHLENLTAGISYRDEHLVTGSMHPLLFSGKTSIDIPAGASVVSDPVAWEIPDNSLLAISFYVPKFDGSITFHRGSYQISFTDTGNVSSEKDWKDAKKITGWYFVSGVDVLTEKPHPLVIAIGDSITEGACSTPNANHRWPDFLAERLQHAGSREVVLDEGIGGNRVVKESAGPSLLARLDRDVLAYPEVKYVILLEGINDIGRTAFPKAPGDEVTADQIISGYQTVVDKLRKKHIRAIGATITPYSGAFFFSADGETMRRKLNEWIRTPGHFDDVIDFEAAIRDPQHTDQVQGRYDCGDHLHPNDDGYRAMGDAIDLKLFGEKSAK